MKSDITKGLWSKMAIYSSPCVPTSHHLLISAEALKGQCSAPACCSGQTGSSSASYRRTSGETPPSTDALPHLCCLCEQREPRLFISLYMKKIIFDYCILFVQPSVILNFKIRKKISLLLLIMSLVL